MWHSVHARSKIDFLVSSFLFSYIEAECATLLLSAAATGDPQDVEEGWRGHFWVEQTRNVQLKYKSNIHRLYSSRKPVRLVPLTVILGL